ncbi:MAG: ASCH domain-containing protein [Thermoguttaceae bacterium]|nr:ASCH domain-containing protein [Thermoguttaceae bacterium]
MLTFKRKFWDAVLSGEKTQTLRIWKTLRIRENQKSYAPGIGPLWIDSIEEVSFEELTDADAIPDGFSSIEALRKEIRAI